MLNGIKAKLASIGTLKALCENAEKYALQDQQREPAAEHFLLAAIDLPDNTGQQTFREIGADAGGVRGAIRSQYAQSLRDVGLSVSDYPDPVPLLGEGGIYRAAASGEAVLQQLAATRSNHHPLIGAHVVAVVATFEQGVAARALRSMGIDLAALKKAAEAISATYARSHPLSNS